MKKLLLLTLLFVGLTAQCIHDTFSPEVQKFVYDDTEEIRLLQASSVGPLRIYMDYNNLKSGGATEKNLAKRMMNITANYFYKVLTVQRLSSLKFPSTATCGSYAIPNQYKTTGVTGDLGLFVGNVPSDTINYIAKSSICVSLASNKRPSWGLVIWNNDKIQQFDQQTFQQYVNIAFHQVTHVLGFSASVYADWKVNPLIATSDGHYLKTSEINAQVNSHFGCSNGKGMKLQDQDGSLIASHWERHDIGGDYMISTNKKNSFVSAITLAIFQSTGWYQNVDYSFAQPNTWGKGKGCNFLDIDNCEFDEFCSGRQFDCDWDATGFGRCGVDSLAGTCSSVGYYTNTICIDENYYLKIQNVYTQINNGNSVQTYERGGYNSRCFKSDYRKIGQNNFLDQRCYVSVCSSSGQYVYLLVHGYILVCRFPGQSIPALPGLEGTLQCPSNFDLHCQSKKVCAYNCNMNGACINGQCLCHNSLSFSPSCLSHVFTNAQNPHPIGGRLLNDILKPIIIEDETINQPCFEGTVLDPLTGECERCKKVFDCENCTSQGCLPEGFIE